MKTWEDNIMQLQNARFLQNLLENAGYKTLAAGGFVRDYLLNRPYNDIDLATEATPHEVIKVLTEANIKTVETGLKHGTITAVLLGINCEITTLRVDKKTDGRHAEVEFIKSFEEDAKRRDLTVNALFMDLNTMEVFDYVGGQEDIKTKTLRFVGNANDRVREDYLRILRFCRFSSQLGFKIQREDYLTIWFYAEYLRFISPERIREELLKTIIGDYYVLHHLWIDNLILKIIPELNLSFTFKQKCEHHCYDVLEHTIVGLQAVSKYKDPILSMAFLLHDVAKPYCHTEEDNVDHFYGHEIEGERIAEYVCDRLKFSLIDKKVIKFLIKHHMDLHQNLNKKSIRLLINKCLDLDSNEGALNVHRLLYMMEADYSAMKSEFFKDFIEIRDKVLKIFNEMHDNKFIAKSPLDGAEIMIGFRLTEGKKVGIIKNFLKQKVIEGELNQEDKETAILMVKKEHGLL